MTEFKRATKNDSLIVLVEHISEIDGLKFELACREEYYNEPKPDKPSSVWGGVDVIFEDKAFPIWLGDIPRDSEAQLKLLLDHVDKFEFIDKRDEGYYCIYCKTFRDNPIMQTSETSMIVNQEDKAGPRWLVKDHYDGCRGWN